MNDTHDALEVICAWPVSSQYGPGSRVLYYILIAACVFARKIEWLKNAALAAALLLPAVAAIHGIVLAAMHRDGGVDLDLYGAFQLCAVGVVVAPVTVRMSKTYFYDPARNAIFVWLGLILAGLVSFTIEFYRSTSSPCPRDDSGNPIPNDPARFPYGQATCGLVCDTTHGPFSPMRGGSADNVYVIPAPHALPFGSATLLSAACCVHAILWLVSMWDKILDINWKKRFRRHADAGGDNRAEDEEAANEPIPGTNGATQAGMNKVNGMITLVLGLVVIPIFAGAGLAIIIVGERNFFSKPMRYEIEPMASVGQWGPIVGTGFAIVGSLYIVFAKDLSPEKEAGEDGSSTAMQQDGLSTHHDQDQHPSPAVHHGPQGSPRLDSASSNDDRPSLFGGSELFTSMTRSRTHRTVATVATTTAGATAASTGTGGRRKVRRMAIWLSKKTNIAHGFDEMEFRAGAASAFPEIPGERWRRDMNPVLDAYEYQVQRSPSVRPRAESFLSDVSAFDMDDQQHDGGPSPPSPTHPRSPRVGASSPPPAVLGRTQRRPHANTLPSRTSTNTSHPSQQDGKGKAPRSGRSSLDQLAQSGGPSTPRMPARRDTLEVPTATRGGSSGRGSPSPEHLQRSQTSVPVFSFSVDSEEGSTGDAKPG